MDIIDQTQLNECMTGELELDRDLMQSAMEEIQSRSLAMQQAFANQDHDAWRANAHRSVGAASTLGFVALAAEFRDAEHHTTTDPERAAALEKIHTLIASTRQTLGEMGLL